MLVRELPRQWMASQYHRPHLDEGMILFFRHAESSYHSAELSLHGLNPEAIYELQYELADRTVTAKGAELMTQFRVTIPQRHRSELIVYRRKED